MDDRSQGARGRRRLGEVGSEEDGERRREQQTTAQRFIMCSRASCKLQDGNCVGAQSAASELVVDASQRRVRPVRGGRRRAACSGLHATPAHAAAGPGGGRRMVDGRPMAPMESLHSPGLARPLGAATLLHYCRSQLPPSIAAIGGRIQSRPPCAAVLPLTILCLFAGWRRK